MKKVPVTKLSRALNLALTPKAARIMIRRPQPPGQHGKARRSQKSTFGLQLLEKQRLKAQFNVSEKQLRNYFRRALKSRGATGAVLLQELESRLDAFVLRAGYASTIYAARQLVNHAHVLVNGRSVSKPSRAVEAGDVVSLKERSRKHPQVLAHFPQAIRPSYIHADSATLTATKIREPVREEIPVTCDEQMIVEFFSR